MTSASTITVGYDGSPSARQALTWAMTEAHSRGVALRVVYTLSPPVATTGLGYAPVADLAYIDEIKESAKSMVAEAVASVRDELKGIAVDIEQRVEVGSPSGMLIEFSEHSGLLVVGSRGYGGFRGLLLGSVGVQTASHSTCPTIVVRGLPKPEARRVVVGVDGSPLSRDALHFGFDFASRHGYELVALHAWELPTYDVLATPAGPAPAMFADIADDEMRMAAEQLAGFGQEYPDVDVHERLVKAPATHSLLEASADAALVVVGSRGRGEFLGTLLGSVSQGLLHRAEVPVAVIHPRSEG